MGGAATGRHSIFLNDVLTPTPKIRLKTQKIGFVLSYLTSFFLEFPLTRISGFLEGAEEFVGAIELAVEAPFVAEEV